MARTAVQFVMDSPSSRNPADQTKVEAAEHIALEASRLARIANSKELPLPAHLIDMVVLEAWREATESDATAAGDSFLP